MKSVRFIAPYHYVSRFLFPAWRFSRTVGVCKLHLPSLRNSQCIKPVAVSCWARCLTVAPSHYLFCYLYFLKIPLCLMFSSRCVSSVNALTSLCHNFLVLGPGGHDKTCMTAVGYIQTFLLVGVLSKLNLQSAWEKIWRDWNVQIFRNVNAM